jgi:two-component system chemotaxis sensor kinase CheA
MIYRIVIQPLMALRSGADKMASGDFNQVFTVARQDEIGELAHSFNKMSEAVLSSQGKLEDFIHRLEDMVQEKTASIQNLLDNAGQGFLSFDRNFVIQPEFSRECQNLFGPDFRSGARIDHFFFDNETEREGCRSWLINAFEDKIDFDVIKELAPNQLKVGDKICSMEYRLLKVGETRLLMTILTNITDRVRLEKRVKEEQAFARMILKVLESKEEFSAFLEEFDVMSDNMQSWLKKPSREDIVELFRKVHTIKGHAAAFDFVHLTESLHELESLMQDTRTSPPSDPIPLKQLQDSFDNVLQKMDSLKVVLKDSLKDAVDWEQKRIQISEALLQRILAKVKDSDSRLHDELLACVHKPLQAMLSQYPALVDSLADRCGKLVHPVSIEGEPVYVDPDRFKPLVRSLVHLFRNAVDHGIEDPELRDSIGKDPYGTIKIEVMGNENGIMLKISDDGAGICPEKVVQSVLKKGLKTKEQVESMSVADQQMLIFLPGFSTREVTTDLSGRGIGMDAVMAEIKALMGSIDVESTTGNGTTFTILLPIQPEN